MTEPTPLPQSENAKEEASCKKKPRSKELSKDHPRNMRFTEIEISALNRIQIKFPHLNSQVEAARYAIRCFAAEINPKPVQFRSVNPEIIFIVQGLLDEIQKAHKQNYNKTLRLRPKSEKTQEEALKTLQLIDSETAILSQAAKKLSDHSKLSSEISAEDVSNIKATIPALEKSIKALQENGKETAARQHQSVLKALKGLVAQ